MTARTWRFVCPDCGASATEWFPTREVHHCQSCCDQFPELLDKKTGKLVARPSEVLRTE